MLLCAAHSYVCRHTQARLHMSRDVEGLIRAGLPHFTWVMTSSSFRLAYLYQV